MAEFGLAFGMSALEIRFATVADRPALIDFLRDHWRADHVFVKAPQLLDWQHLAADGQTINFMIAVQDGRLLAVNGIIPTSHFDPALAEHRQIFKGIWKVADDCELPGVGLALLLRLRSLVKPSLVGIVGLSKAAATIYRAMGYQSGRMGQFVLFADDGQVCRIAAHVPVGHGVAAPGGGVVLRALDEAGLDALGTPGEAPFAAFTPVKSRRYLLNRYVRHPWYAYRLHAIEQHGVLVGYVVLRVNQANDAKALRIVDLICPDAVLGFLGPELQRLRREAGAEYVDLVGFGYDATALARAGFLDRRACPGLVVPNYFEPFVQANVDLDFACLQQADPDGRLLRLVRGDGDQDRPSILPDAAGQP